ncbi:MAG: hypothetical protein ACO39X_02195, partial [Candidatus Nanopelagicaceae bacterium]
RDANSTEQILSGWFIRDIRKHVDNLAVGVMKTRQINLMPGDPSVKVICFGKLVFRTRTSELALEYKSKGTRAREPSPGN